LLCMKKYFVKTPWWLKRIFSSYVWSVKTKEKIIYLSFDDGPHPVATPFVLDELKKYNAKATFFCIGKNVVAQPAIYRRILDEGHSVGNHTYNHVNGWKTKDDVYLQDVKEAGKVIDSRLFRPPYGRITSFQAKNISGVLNRNEVKIIMWDVISADFDESLDGNDCVKNVILNAKNGSIVVFHDSEKALSRLTILLPAVLNYFEKSGFRFERLNFF
jgi:peptidoglycan/xylan/chitin deacetylase (PgdA/CDA1 family)